MRYHILIALLFILLGCKDKEKEYIEQIVREWTGKEIVFPENIPSKIFGQDTNCNYLLSKPAKVLVYTDSTGCTACKLNFYDWMLKIKSLESNKDVSFLFYVHSQNYKTFTNALKGEEFDYPIFYDTQNVLANQNHFPKNERFHTFLLNESNHVVLIGNPLGRENMWKLYLQQIDSITQHANHSINYKTL